MPHLTILLDVDERGGFNAVKDAGLAGIEGQESVAAGKLIHLGNDAQIEVGTLRHGMKSGKDSCAFCFTLPDGRIVVAETSVELFVATARAITAWQEGRRDRGED